MHCTTRVWNPSPDGSPWLGAAAEPGLALRQATNHGATYPELQGPGRARCRQVVFGLKASVLSATSNGPGLQGQPQRARTVGKVPLDRCVDGLRGHFKQRAGVRPRCCERRARACHRRSSARRVVSALHGARRPARARAARRNNVNAEWMNRPPTSRRRAMPGGGRTRPCAGT